MVVNADAAAVASGLFGSAARGARRRPPNRRDRSLSALTWAMLAEAEGFPLLRHTVFFSDDYPAEFEDLFTRNRLPAAPTAYICAQDRGAGPEGRPAPPVAGGRNACSASSTRRRSAIPIPQAPRRSSDASWRPSACWRSAA